MLPRTRLGAQQLRKLKVYAGGEHPHEAQVPAPLPGFESKAVAATATVAKPATEQTKPIEVAETATGTPPEMTSDAAVEEAPADTEAVANSEAQESAGEATADETGEVAEAEPEAESKTGGSDA
jgi:hypothetical protein